EAPGFAALNILSPHSRSFERQALCPPCEIKLHIGQLGGAGTRHFGTDAEQAGANAPLQRTQCLPLEPIGGKRVAVALTDRLGVQPLAPVLLVALRAREIHLTMPRRVESPAALEARALRSIDARRSRHSARLIRHIGGQREELVGLVFERL